jgi:hypothetical protein
VSDPLKLTQECVVSFIERISLLNDLSLDVGGERQVSYTDVRSDLHLSVLWEFSETISTVCDSM